MELTEFLVHLKLSQLDKFMVQFNNATELIIVELELNQMLREEIVLQTITMLNHVLVLKDGPVQAVPNVVLEIFHHKIEADATQLTAELNLSLKLLKAVDVKDVLMVWFHILMV
jgi:hypothetical protein